MIFTYRNIRTGRTVRYAHEMARLEANPDWERLGEVVQQPAIEAAAEIELEADGPTDPESL